MYIKFTPRGSSLVHKTLSCQAHLCDSPYMRPFPVPKRDTHEISKKIHMKYQEMLK